MISKHLFGSWLAAQMRVAGYDKTLLARDLGVTHVAVSDWLANKYLPSSPKITPIARVLGVEESEVRKVIVAGRAKRHRQDRGESVETATVDENVANGARP